MGVDLLDPVDSGTLLRVLPKPALGTTFGAALLAAAPTGTTPALAGVANGLALDAIPRYRPTREIDQVITLLILFQKYYATTTRY